MSNLRRYYKEGNLYFLTNVTYRRKPILVDNIDLFWIAMSKTKAKMPFDIVAWVILPDHFHVILNPMQSTPSNILKRVKLSFLRNYKIRIGVGSGRVWQPRFWDHVIRSQDDMNRHIDYIHYNPVKHNHVTSPFDYPHSSIAIFRQDGLYGADWGKREPAFGEGDFGE